MEGEYVNKPFSLDYPNVVLVALTATVGVALVVAASTSGAAFGTYNPAWDGTADVRTVAAEANATVTVARETNAYREVPANDTVALVLAPTSSYDSAATAAVRSFVENGGMLVVAASTNQHAAGLLATVGADARMDGRPLRDERHYYRSPAFPVADNVSDHELTANVDAVTLNHGTAVEPNGATVLISTSEYAYVDANRNEQPDDDEELARHPVVTVEDVGDGRVVVVGDPSAFINVMLDRSGNRAFARTLFELHDQAMFDVSHAESLPPLALVVLVLRDVPLLGAGAGCAAVAGVALWVRWPAVAARRRTPTTADEPVLTLEEKVDAVAKQHPEWSRAQVRRLVDRPTDCGDQPESFHDSYR